MKVSRWGVLAAGSVLLIVGGALIAFGLSAPASEPLHVIIVRMFVAGLFGLILSFCGVAALAVGAWIAVRARDGGNEA